MGEAKRRKAFDPNYGKPKGFTPYQRANKMYELVFACHMPMPYDETDSPYECDTAIQTWADMALSEVAVANHPLKKHKTVEELLAWFNLEYPLVVS